jgi:hypothetical protein
MENHKKGDFGMGRMKYHPSSHPNQRNNLSEDALYLWSELNARLALREAEAA